MTQTRLILNPSFIDTSIFVAHHFSFSSRQFEQIAEFSREKSIKLISTEITHREILNKIAELSKTAEHSFNHFIRKYAFIKHNTDGDLGDLGRHFDSTEIGERCKRNYEKWLQDTNIEILPISYSDVSKVFDLYFSKRPPFRRKKNEFPDAFNLSIICNSYENLHIISNDADLQEFEHPSISKAFNSLNAFIDFILKQEYSIYDLLTREYNKHKQTIIDQIREGFATLEVIAFNGSFTEAPKVTDVIIKEEKIIEIEDNKAVFNLSLIIRYEVMVFYDKENDYKLETDFHSMDVEIEFTYRLSSDKSTLMNVNIESISPKSWEYNIIMLHEEDFLNREW